ncbi:MAG: TIGR03546 family protein [Saccharospirillum sp.]|nr:TIGR03546 family protein [Saccharospirillum sp.]
MLTQVAKVLKALNSEAGPWQIAFAVGFALIIGLTPLWSLHNLLVLLLVFVLRTHLSTFFVFWAIFSGFAYMLDGWFDQVGYQMLTSPGLEGFWTALYQNDWWQVSRFNHTITVASLVVSLSLFLPVVVISRIGILRYRDKLMPVMSRLKVVQVIKTSRLFEIYQRLS